MTLDSIFLSKNRFIKVYAISCGLPEKSLGLIIRIGSAPSLSR